MKTVKLLAMVAVVGLFSYALIAADGDTPKPERPKGIRGKITKVGDKSITIQTMAREEADRKTLEIAVDEKTTVKIEDKDAKVADLKVDMRVSITPETASDKVPAATITVMKPRAEARELVVPTERSPIRGTTPMPRWSRPPVVPECPDRLIQGDIDEGCKAVGDGRRRGLRQSPCWRRIARRPRPCTARS